MGEPAAKRHELKLLAVCMTLLALAAGWLLSTRPGHRIEADFLEREQSRRADAWLIEQAAAAPIAEHRARACLALGRIGGVEAREALIAAARDAAPSLRAAAAFGLGLLIDQEAEPPVEAVEALADLLDDAERLVVARAVDALGKSRRADLAEQLTRTAAPLVFTLPALARLEASDLIPWIAERLKSDDQDVRWAAAVALNELEAPCDDDIRRSFSNLIRDRNEFVRAAAARGLGRCASDEPSQTALGRALADPDPKVRFEAVRAVVAAGARGLVEPLAGLIGDPNPAVRRAALEAAAALTETARAGPFQEALRAPSPYSKAAPRDPQASMPAGVVEPLDPPDLEVVARTTGATLRVETAEGAFDIQLDYEHAPLAAERLRQLAAAGGVDGARISRARPNGYLQIAPTVPPAVPSQPNPEPFLRGSVGLVRLAAGRDSLEFFIALTPLPFADGRYTNVGRLINGDDLLDRLTAQTSIARITLVE